MRSDGSDSEWEEVTSLFVRSRNKNFTAMANCHATLRSAGDSFIMICARRGKQERRTRSIKAIPFLRARWLLPNNDRPLNGQRRISAAEHLPITVRLRRICGLVFKMQNLPAKKL